MDDVVIDVTDPEILRAEVNRLRAETARLKERIELLDRLAHRDVLIDLPNRRGFLRHLEAAIDRVSRYDDVAAMLFVDVDGLKLINDTLGHQAGDQALGQVARLLVSGVRKSDLVARIGGDEFAIILGYADEDSARETANRLVDLIAGSEFEHDGELLPLSVAIGAAGVKEDDTPETVLARADQEMYRRKAAA